MILGWRDDADLSLIAQPALLEGALGGLIDTIDEGVVEQNARNLSKERDSFLDLVFNQRRSDLFHEVVLQLSFRLVFQHRFKARLVSARDGLSFELVNELSDTRSLFWIVMK